ncbi:MAG: cytochrome c peroxidase [Planctomycetota bacterium]|jgi:cytochrome c peroxidase
MKARNCEVLKGMAVLALVIGTFSCGVDKGPLASDEAEMGGSAAKLTLSKAKAGGYSPQNLLPREEAIATYGLKTLGEIPYPPNNPHNPERVELGQLLFFDPILGGEKDVSCGTCHHPDLGFADGRDLSAGTGGVGLGPDRQVLPSAITGDAFHAVPRNAPTIWNTAFNQDSNGRTTHLSLQFLDGRVEGGLEEQATKPPTSRVEMAGDAYPGEVAIDSLVVRLREIPEYVELFERAFADEGIAGAEVINEDTYGRAVAAYERELVGRNTAYDLFVNGDENALDRQQRWGMELFHTKAKCSVCHSGAMFTDFRFIVNGVPQIGPGKRIIPGDDTGREEATKDPADRFAFRTTTLRNIELTGPYMHGGVFATLTEVIEFYNDGALPRHPAVSDDMLDTDLKTPLGLNPSEVSAVVAFMKALTDNGSAIDPQLLRVPERVPSGLAPVFGVRAQ